MTTEADQVIAPTEGNVYSRANVAAAERVTVPDEWFGRYVTFEVFGEDTYILFGDGSVTATINGTKNTKTGEGINKSDSVSLRIAAGTRVTFIVPRKYTDSAGVDRDVTSFSFISGAAPSGEWVARVDSV